jgi:benzylsuccinate CoA-transferase BbsF subunit
VTLDLSQPQGVELAKRIIKISDALVENFAAKVMAKLGLNYEAVRTIKPDIVYISLAPYGANGPYKDYVSYGRPQIYTSGLAHISGYPDREPHYLGISWPDPVAALHGAFALLSALHYRDRTGVGQYIELS